MTWEDVTALAGPQRGLGIATPGNREIPPNTVFPEGWR